MSLHQWYTVSSIFFLWSTICLLASLIKYPWSVPIWISCNSMTSVYQSKVKEMFSLQRSLLNAIHCTLALVIGGFLSWSLATPSLFWNVNRVVYRLFFDHWWASSLVLYRHFILLVWRWHPSLIISRAIWPVVVR